MKAVTSKKGPAKKSTALTTLTDNWPFIRGEAAGDSALRRQMIATAAYFRAEQRGFEAGYHDHDWFAAEAEVDNAIGNAVPGFI